MALVKEIQSHPVNGNPLHVDFLRDAITAEASISKIRQLAADRVMVTLQHDGFRKVREGITSVEEIMHVAGDTSLHTAIP